MATIGTKRQIRRIWCCQSTCLTLFNVFLCFNSEKHVLEVYHMTVILQMMSNIRRSSLVINVHLPIDQAGRSYYLVILRIYKKDWQRSPRFSGKFYLYCKLLTDMLILLKNILGKLQNQLSIIESPRSIDTLSSVSRRTAKPENRKIGEPRIQLSILLQDSKNLPEDLAWSTPKFKIAA